MSNTDLITELKLMDTRMADIMFKCRPDESITREHSDEVWNRTAWHRIIEARIEELSKSKIVLA